MHTKQQSAAEPEFFSRAWQTIGELIHEYWPVTFVAAGGIAMTFGKGFLTEGVPGETWLHFAGRCLFGAFLFVIFLGGAYGQYVRNGRIRELKKENQELKGIVARLDVDYFEIWKIRLAGLFKQIGLDAGCRISIYRYSRGYKVFYMIGRYAEIEEFSQRGKRSVYHAGSGCVGVAWSSAPGEAYVDDLPSPSDPNYTRRNIEEWGLDEAVAAQIRMKSRSIAAFALKDVRDIDRIAVIVFESVAPQAFDVALLRETVTGSIGRELSQMLQALRFIEPSPDEAKERGF